MKARHDLQLVLCVGQEIIMNTITVQHERMSGKIRKKI